MEENNYEKDLLLIQQDLQSWRNLKLSEVSFERMYSGLSSQVFKVSVLGDDVNSVSPSIIIYRRIGGNSIYADEAYWIKLEKSFKVMSDLNIGPRYLGGKHDSYRIEEFINSNPIEANKINDPILRKKLGYKLGRIHSIDFDLNKTNYIEDFVKNQKIIDQIKFNLSLDVYTPKQEEVLREIETLIKDEAINKVLSHNDIWVGNILVNRESNDVIIIDYERFGYNFAGYDLGKLIIETMYERDETGVAYTFQEKNFPSDDEIKDVLKAYILGRSGSKLNLDDFLKLSDETQEKTLKLLTEVNIDSLFKETRLGMAIAGFYTVFLGLMVGKTDIYKIDFIQFAIDGFYVYSKYIKYFNI